ncbi:MAG: hypothetical protein IT176_09565, partial [Acidobacteria bacterium]|nr:hypothetical protein [Acidobacteriota bacterium]
TPSGEPPVPVSATNVRALALTPGGTAIYLASGQATSSGILRFAVDPATGHVEPGGGPFGTGNSWYDLVVIGGPPVP